MEKLRLEEPDRPLYLGHGSSSYGLDLYFGPDGDFFAMTQVVESIRRELDDRGFPVVAITWSTHAYADRDALGFHLSTENLAVPEELLNEMRLAVNVRCWGRSDCHIEEFYLDDQHLNTGVLFVLFEGRASPNYTELERNGVTVDRTESGFKFLANGGDDTVEVFAIVVAEALGIFIHGGVKPPTKTPLQEVIPASEEAHAEPDAPDSVTALQRLWELSPPPDSD